MRDECNSHQEAIGSIPIRSTVTEPEVVEGLVCDTSVSEFNSRQSPQMEGAAEWTATGLENQGEVILRGSIPPPSSLALKCLINGGDYYGTYSV